MTSDSSEDTSTAPWTAEQAENLRLYQKAGMFHPYTCGGGGGPCSGVSMDPTPDGLVCPQCGRVQTWVAGFAVSEKMRELTAARNELFTRPRPPEPAPGALTGEDAALAGRDLLAFAGHSTDGRPVPGHLRAAAAIRVQIRSGQLKAGDPLPSARVLAAQLGITQQNARTAIENLRRDGVVSTSRGAPTRVTGALPSQQRLADRVAELEALLPALLAALEYYTQRLDDVTLLQREDLAESLEQMRRGEGIVRVPKSGPPAGT